VERYIAEDHDLLRAIAQAVAAPVAESDIARDRLKEVAPPRTELPTASGDEEQTLRERNMHLPVNYLEREARNASVGRAGELLVLSFERHRLASERRADLAGLVRHVALDDDGAGFDVLSFDKDGVERFIEVKSTSYGKETPFFVSRNEVEVSREHALKYHLYRVFKLRDDPSVFTVRGSLSENFDLSAEIFRARVA
jgi:hypothetical protein